MKHVTKFMAILLILTLALPLLTIPVLAQSLGNDNDPLLFYRLPLKESKAARSKLVYSLQYDQAVNELSLNVTNNTARTMELTFPSGKKFDLTIFNKSGQKVWQLSAGQYYPQYVVKERLNPGQTKQYNAQMPSLAPGQYTVVANYYAAGSNDIVAITTITVKSSKKTYPGLKFDATYSSGQQPKIIFAVRNLTASPITVTFPTGQKFEVVVRGSNGFTWRSSNSPEFRFTASSETIGAGVNRFNYLYLPKLAPGQYTAQVYYLGVSSAKPVATTSFTVR